MEPMALLPLLTIVALAQTELAWDLKLQPPLGTTVTLDQKLAFETGPESYVIREEEARTARQTNSRGEITWEKLVTPLEAILDGQKLPMQQGVKPLKIKEVRSALGLLIERTSMQDDDHTWTRLIVATTVVFKGKPVMVGDRWKVKVHEDRGTGNPGALMSYRLASVAPAKKPTTGTIELAYEELIDDGVPMKGAGTVTVDLKTGVTLGMALTYEDAPIPGGEEPAKTLKWTSTLKKFKLGPSDSKVKPKG